jgi:hypothetical protein
MNKSDFIDVIELELKDLASKFVDDDYDNAIDSAEGELWPLPQIDKFRLLWLKKRTKRHLFDMMSASTASKSQIKTFKLNQQFEHYRTLVKEADQEFEKVKEDSPELFPVQDPSDVSPYQMFGTQASAGFAYDDAGNDLTYNSDNQVKYTPGDTD